MTTLIIELPDELATQVQGRGISQQRLEKDEVIRFCLEIAEENIRRTEDETIQPKTIAEIADWFRHLLGMESLT